MGLFNKKKKGDSLSAAAVQTTSNTRHPYYQLNSYMPMNASARVYIELRKAVPVIDAAINKIIRLHLNELAVRCFDE